MATMSFSSAITQYLDNERSLLEHMRVTERQVTAGQRQLEDLATAKGMLPDARYKYTERLTDHAIVNTEWWGVQVYPDRLYRDRQLYSGKFKVQTDNRTWCLLEWQKHEHIKHITCNIVMPKMSVPISGEALRHPSYISCRDAFLKYSVQVNEVVDFIASACKGLTQANEAWDTMRSELLAKATLVVSDAGIDLMPFHEVAKHMDWTYQYSNMFIRSAHDQADRIRKIFDTIADYDLALAAYVVVAGPLNLEFVNGYVRKR